MEGATTIPGYRPNKKVPAIAGTFPGSLMLFRTEGARPELVEGCRPAHALEARHLWRSWDV